MKSLILHFFAALLIGLPISTKAQGFGNIRTNVLTLAQRMAAYEKGQMTLEQITDDKDWAKELVEYSQDHTNGVPIKWKLPISRCLAGLGNYPAAERAATEYVRAFPNDGRGWRIVGSAKLMQGAYENAIDPLRKAVKFGDNYAYKGLGAAAMALGRADLLKEIAPHLFQLKDSKEVTEKKEKLDIIVMLVLDSMSERDERIFIKSLEGITAAEIVAHKDLASYVKAACEQFNGWQVKELRGEIERLQSQPATEAKQKGLNR